MFEVLVDRLCRWITLYGGRGSGKSRTATLVTDIIILLQHRFIAVARDYKDDVEHSIWRNIILRIHELELSQFFTITKERITCHLTGSEIIPYGLLDNPDKIKSLEDCDLLIMEESAHTPRYVWETVIPTIRKNGASILTIFNPDWLLDETYRRLVTEQELLDLGRFTRHINYLDNPFCPESTMVEAETMKIHDPERYEHIYLGKPRETSYRQILQGVYEVKPFSLDDIETNKNSANYAGVPKFHQGVEWGYSQKPTAIVVCYEYDECLWIWKCAGGVGLEIDDIAKCIDETETPAERKFKASPALPATLRTVRKKCKKSRLLESEKWTGEDLDRIKFLRGSYARIYIHPSCEAMIEDFENYWWEVDDKRELVLSKPIDENNQYIKALCHALCRRVKGVA